MSTPAYIIFLKKGDFGMSNLSNKRNESVYANELQRLFGDFLGFGREFGNNYIEPSMYKMSSFRSMRTDIVETDKDWKFTVELPGYDKKDISVKLEDSVLLITASKDEESTKENAEGKVIYSERHTGSCSRRFTVPSTVKKSDISAHFENGILTVNVLKEVKQEEEDFSISID